MSERATYYAWRGNGITDMSLLSDVQQGGERSGYSVPVQVADLSRGERVVSAEAMERIVFELRDQIGNALGLARHGPEPKQDYWSRIATELSELVDRLTEGRE